MDSIIRNEADAALVDAAVKKAGKTFPGLVMLGILAGIYISFGGHLFLAALSHGAGRMAASFLFSVGLVLVVLTGAELFTGNMILVVGLVHRHIGAGGLLKNWSAVYLGNLIGSLGYAFLVMESGLFGRPGNPTELGALAAAAAAAKAALPFGPALVRGILCNILVVLAVVTALSARRTTAKILCCILPVGAFVALGFEHCVANMFLIPVGFLASGVPAADWISAVPGILTVTLGNIIGGVFILLAYPDRFLRIVSGSGNRRTGGQ